MEGWRRRYEGRQRRSRSLPCQKQRQTLIRLKKTGAEIFAPVFYAFLKSRTEFLAVTRPVADLGFLEDFPVISNFAPVEFHPAAVPGLHREKLARHAERPDRFLVDRGHRRSFLLRSLDQVLFRSILCWFVDRRRSETQ